ncbi:TIR domain-containing protein [Sphingomonas hankyongi]|uniref:TIR domain-containing protein n=1 Tax=Sphingomonas hankyongi TaxID=2908209 RepID=A0ABT0RXY1_9SPHN|nr:TIR domain-containing protein [Sphingomonas hankyongi]MCL6728468.1 TIR domain-containing protein [Sphingomonas hankyongi]
MSDVFVSYARPDEPHAVRVADALRSEGYQVWRDDELPAHRTYSEVIEERLKSAQAVVVLWSAEAVKSQWVRAEADAARSAGTLVQVTLDGAIPPLPFNQIQCAQLIAWDGKSCSGWQKLLSSVQALAGAPAKAAPDVKRRQQVSVCVLPFQNMSGDAEQEYFSDGISEDITTDLSKISALAVTARNTAFAFKGQAGDVSEIARKLGVSHVLEGSVRKSGGRVRITAQLIDGASGDHAWAERYDRELTDIFAIQDEISKAIVDALKLKLLPSEKKAIEQRGTSNVDAYNLYLMARQLWVSGNYGDVRRDEIVIRTAQRAIALDANYAEAWALLAVAQASMRYHHGRDVDDGLAAAEKALELNPTLAAAYSVRARHIAEHGDFERAEAEIRHALELDPNSWEANREAARLLMQHRRVEEAMHHYELAASLDENDFHSCMMLTTCCTSLGLNERMPEVAQRMLERSERVLEQDSLNASALGVSAAAFVILGDLHRARERIERAMMVDPDNINMPYNFACVLAVSAGDIDGALDMIEPLMPRQSRSLMLTMLADPDMDPLRDHPRFKRMVAEAMERTGVTEDMVPDEARLASGDTSSAST